MEVQLLHKDSEGCVIDNIEMCEYESHSKMYDNLTEIQKMFPKIAKVTILRIVDSGMNLY